MARIGLGNDRHQCILTVGSEWNGGKRMRSTHYRNIPLKISALNKAKKPKAAWRETRKGYIVIFLNNKCCYVKTCRGGMRNLHYMPLKDNTDFIPQLPRKCEHTCMYT